MRILVMCTANICRSPMAERLLRRHAEARGVDAEIHSAGLLAGGQPAASGSRRVLAPMGLLLDDHVSQRIEAGLVEAADLVLAMEVRHVREAAVLAPHKFPAIFTIRELVRRARAVGPRRERPIAEWLGELADGRKASELMGATDLDVADPYGGPDRGYSDTLAELVALTDELADFLWGPQAA